MTGTSKHSIAYAILVFIVIASVFECTDKTNRLSATEGMLNTEKQKAASLLDSLFMENRLRDLNIAQKKKAIDSLEGVVRRLVNDTNSINQKRDEKIDVIDSYDIAQLQQYFANRYGRE